MWLWKEYGANIPWIFPHTSKWGMNKAFGQGWVDENINWKSNTCWWLLFDNRIFRGVAHTTDEWLSVLYININSWPCTLTDGYNFRAVNDFGGMHASLPPTYRSETHDDGLLGGRRDQEGRLGPWKVRHRPTASTTVVFWMCSFTIGCAHLLCMLLSC